MQHRDEPIVDVDRKPTKSTTDRDSDVGSSTRPGRLLVAATVTLTAVMFAWLIVRPPFPLSRTTVADRLSISVQSGSAGAEAGESGPLWWLTSAPVLIGVANNTADTIGVDVSMLVTNGPCPVGRTGEFGGEDFRLDAGEAILVSTDAIELNGYERLSLPLELDGDPCPATDSEPRELLVALSELELREVDR